MIEQFDFSRLIPSTVLKPFDCDDIDLREFLLNDAVNYAKELLAVTYILEDTERTIGYFSLLNDSIRQGDSTKNRIKKVFKLISHNKRGHNSHPAVKVGRLAVSTMYRSRGIGTELMDFVKGYFIDNNKTGCRFITVDANNNQKTIKFYKDNGFDFLTTGDENEDSRLMFFDLIHLFNRSAASNPPD